MRYVASRSRLPTRCRAALTPRGICFFGALGPPQQSVTQRRASCGETPRCASMSLCAHAAVSSLLSAEMDRRLGAARHDYENRYETCFAQARASSPDRGARATQRDLGRTYNMAID